MPKRDSSYMPGVGLRKALRTRRSLDETIEFLAAECLLGWLRDSEERIKEMGVEAFLARAGMSEEFSMGAEVMAGRKLETPDDLQAYATHLRTRIDHERNATRLEVRFRGEDEIIIRYAAQ